MLILFILLATTLSAQQVSTLVPTEPGVGYEAVNWNPRNGRIVIPDYANNQVHEIFLDGRREVLLPAINQPLGGAWDEAGNFYVSEYGGRGRLFRITPEGQKDTVAIDLGGPAGCLVDSNQQVIYVADYDGSRIYRVHLETGVKDTLAQGFPLNGPDCIIYAPNGDLIINNFNDNKIFRLTTDGDLSVFSVLSGSLNSGYLVRRGHEYIVGGYYSNRLWLVDSSGVATSWSGSSVGSNDGTLEEARYAWPNGIGISADGDSIILSDGNASPRVRLITGLNGATSSVLDRLTAKDFKLTLSPNPASQEVNISFELPETDRLKLTIYSLDGKEVVTLMDSTQQSGPQKVRWDIPATLKNGYYQCILRTKSYLSSAAFLINRNKD